MLYGNVTKVGIAAVQTHFTLFIGDNQQDATILFYLLLISSKCFGRCFRPSLATPASSNIGRQYQKL